MASFQQECPTANSTDKWVKRSILLIAAKDPLGDIFSQALVEEGFDVVVVESYGRLDEVYSELSRKKYDLVIATNNSLTPTHILELIPEIKRRWPDIKVVVLSGYYFPDFVVELKRANIDEFFPSPYRFGDILAKIQGLLAVESAPKAILDHMMPRNREDKRMPEQVTFEQFKKEWLSTITEGNPSTVALGRQFAAKLVMQWLDIGEAPEDLIFCDGSGDGGIDVAYLYRGETHQDDSASGSTGDTWFLVQSKYGSAFAGIGTLLTEAQKVIDTLDGHRANLSSLAQGLLERITTFRNSTSGLDRIILVFGTVDPLNEEEKRALTDVRAMGRSRLGPLFDAEAVSVYSIYQRNLEELAAQDIHTKVKIAGNLVPSGNDLLVGSVSLLNLYDFLKEYRSITEDLDQLYEKNVRRFLGSRGKVNKGVQQTLRDSPENFGLFNNGITIVVEEFRTIDEHHFELEEPFIVNGCQTTRTIWEVCHQRLEAGGTGQNPELDGWRARASTGIVVTKIARVGSDGEALLQDITRYTNSQNAVREKDFLALTSDFRTWAKQMAETHGIYLEIQRGGWDSRRALQRQRPQIEQFTESANAFDLLKVYGAAWLGEAGTAFRSNIAFVPDGVLFKRIVENLDGEETFGIDDLFAAYKLQKSAEGYNFGRGAEKGTRRQTRFLFFMVVFELRHDVMVRAGKPTSRKDETRAFVRLCEPSAEGALKSLLDASADVIDEYLTDGTEDCLFLEPAFKNDFLNDLNAFLKWDMLGRSEEATPRFRSLLAGTKRTMGRRGNDGQSPRELITSALLN